MVFSSLSFLYFFLPITLVCYFLMPRKGKNVILLLASLFFYTWGEQTLVFLFMLTILCGWILGLCIDKTREKRIGRLSFDQVFLGVSIILTVGLLIYFKYADFFVESVNHVFHTSLPLLHVALPIGISFYTFQIMSYVIDVYRNKVRVQKNIIDFALYVAMFPQLIAGPIVRYETMEQQLKHRTHSAENVSDGLWRFVVGLGKKVLIANELGAICTQFRQISEPTVAFYWMYAIAFMLQIYFDFSGYSDMAIGLGKVFGFEFLENFNYPYISSSITEFWRRWHISLGTWFRDYVYIPLGGNKKGVKRQLFHIVIVWMLTGLWHGAAMNFVLWGLFYALLLLLEKLWLKKWLEKHKVVGHIYVLLSVMLGFVLFNAQSMMQVADDLAGLVSFGTLPVMNEITQYYFCSYLVVFLIAIVGATPLPKRLFLRIKKENIGNGILAVLQPFAAAAILVAVTAYLVDGSFNPFLYFRF